MDLTEIKPTQTIPYRCFVSGKDKSSEGPDVQTLGFKDNIAVVQVVPPHSPPPLITMSDKEKDKNGVIDLTKLTKITVKIDPDTGRKYIYKNGQKMELVPQNLKKLPLPQPPPLVKPAPQLQQRDSIIVRTTTLTPPTVGKTQPAVGKTQPTVAKTQPTVAKTPAQLPSAAGGKWRVVTLNVNDFKQKSKSGRQVCENKSVQTACAPTKDSHTQTDGGEPPPLTADAFFQFILGEGEFHEQELNAVKQTRNMAGVDKTKAGEEISKFKFFTDMRKALVPERSGNLPIHESVIMNDVKAVKKNCIVLKAIRQNVNLGNENYYTPLHLAIINNVNIEIVNILLTEGADINLTDVEGNTALHLAVEHKRRGILQVLLNVVSKLHMNIDTYNYDGFTALHLAVLNRSYEDARLLLKHGAEPNMRDMKSGRTALFHACELMSTKLVNLLMDHKADTKRSNFFGTSPHEAMFEIEDMPMDIRYAILGRDNARLNAKRKNDDPNKNGVPLPPIKKAIKLETTPVLRRLTPGEMAVSAGGASNDNNSIRTY